MMGGRRLSRHFNHPPRVERQALIWLIIALIPATLGHWEVLPGWLILFAAAVVAFRMAAFKGWIPELNKWIKASLMVLTVLLFAWTSRRQFTVENAVGFFVLAYCLKLVELKSHRDAYIFSFMTLFLLALGLLFSQSLFRTAFVFTFMGVGLVSLTAVSTQMKMKSLVSSLGSVYRLMLLAVPVLAILYVVFPRFGPLWSMPLNSSSAFTGLDDTVSPGDVANLAQSGERAFRVTFRDNIPLPKDLYWKGLILDRYFSGRWSRSFFQENTERWSGKPRNLSRDEAFDYEVLLDPHNRSWGFSLDGSQLVAGDAYSTTQGLVRFTKEVKSATWYRMKREVQSGEQLTPAEIDRYTKLPQLENPQTITWAGQIVQSHDSPRGQINYVLEFLNENNFFYTLNPPLLPSSDRADAFLFGSRRGFCEHYASSIGILFRAMGIPTRMVVGYQGGEWNTQGGFLVVHQYDAHAWLEVWLRGEGWVRVDPTAAVSPARVESGIREAVAEEGTFLQNSPLSLSRFSDVNIVSWIRDQAEYLNYMWISRVVNYDQESQKSLLSRFLGNGDIKYIAMLLAVTAAVLFGGLGLYSLWPEWAKNRKQPVQRQYHRFVRKLAVKNSSIHPGMTPRQILEAPGNLEADRPTIRSIVLGFERLLFAGVSDRAAGQQLLRQIKRQINRL
ncbi:hypothetical protein BTA51_10735 [Hahella sp. CCB-MM4]|uniref:transglutaminase family protein n=1 Tax=Hahella sp. (strain CCB-MM4) TaxID=1926491 RepID=UPI000B9BE740|nr:DUF3488 and transglutaminase-like domain-containing protein [Hahella sp. CCB-MM4]OZG73484.1 hypothetical protein BTA51_10735 [Hahella sp. CCB-MM4]